jgi:hypothetical protein
MMRKVLCAVVAAVLVLPVAGVAAPTEATVAEIVKAPEKFDGKLVVVRGTVAGLVQKTSGRANPFTRFDLTDGDDMVSVYAEGHPVLKNGDEIKLTGRYAVKTDLNGNVFKNQIQASPSNGGKFEKAK